MAEYKIFASDLDGTMLDKNAQLSKENIEAIKKICATGAHFIPVTGRAYSELPNEIKEMPEISYIINSNGASIYNTKTKTSHTTYIKADAIQEIIEITSKYECLIGVHSDNILLGSEKSNCEDVCDYYNINSFYREIILPLLIPVDNIEQKLLSGMPAEMLVIFFKFEEERKECANELKQIDGIAVTSSAGGNIEIIDASVNKGATLKNVAAVLGVKPSEIIAAGDNYNDISLTYTAGLSLAVSNGVAELIKAADKTICSNDENVAAYVYKNFFEK